MSSNIDVAHVEQYKSNVHTLVQQKGSRLRGAVTIQDVTGKSDWTERIGAVEAETKPSRHADSPLMDTPHSRRRLDLVDKRWGDLIDDEDKVRLLIDPTSNYAMAAAWAMGRGMDDEIIKAATGNAIDENGATVALTSGQKIAVDFVEQGVATDSNLTVGKLRECRRIFMDNDVDEDEELHIVTSASQITSLLRDDEVISGDFNDVKPLVRGEINQFLGFTFHRTKRLAKDSNNVRTCFAWAQSGITLGIGRDIKGRISERADKDYSVYVFYKMSVGATRGEEELVVQLLADEDE